MRRLGPWLAAALLVAVIAPLAVRVRRSWPHRVAVSGHSMEPTLRAGDWLLIDPAAYADRAPAPGDLVVAHDPRRAAQLLIKRVTSIAADGRLRVVGDHPAHAADDALIGPLDQTAIVGRPWLRYWPPERFGQIG